MKKTIQASTFDYLQRLSSSFTQESTTEIGVLAESLLRAWKHKRNVFICGNGGSAANAIHMANDFHYGIGAVSGSTATRSEN